MTSGNRALAEDLCHDAIVAFITRAPTISDKNAACAYVRASIATKHIDIIRSGARETAAKKGLALDPAQNHPADSELERVLAEDSYYRLLEYLNADDQELLGLILMGEPLRRVAAALGISYTATGVRLHRIRNLINRLL